MIRLPAAQFLAPDSTSADLPPDVVAGDVSGSDYLLYTVDDLFSPSIPAALGTTVFDGPVTLPADFLGIHTRTADAAALRNRLVRSHDQAPFWSVLNPGPGVFVDGGLGDWLTAHKAVGATTIYCVFHTPGWASARPAELGDPYQLPGSIAEPADMATLGDFVTWLMTNYGDRIDCLEVWNEPKYMTGLASYFSGTPSALAQIARTIHQAAKAVKPSVRILGVACTGVVVDGRPRTDPSGLDYTRSFLSASDGNGGTGRDWLDVLSVHTYVHDGANSIELMLGLKAALDEMKADLGIASMPVWATEFGYITPPFEDYHGPSSRRLQAIARYALYHVVAGIERCCMYSFTSNLGWGGDAESNGHWNTWCDLVNGATVTRINKVGGALACVIDGRNVLV